MIPSAVLANIELTTGVKFDRQFHKIARLGRCDVCRARVIRGMDDEHSPAVVDLAELTAVGEVWALFHDRKTYRLYGSCPAVWELWYRHAWSLRDWPIGITDSAGKVYVVAGHRCNDPAPKEYTT